MSHAATNWAINQRGLKPATKIVLWHLCDRHNPDFGCFPSQERLARDCEISRSGLNNHLDALEQRGLLRRLRRSDPVTQRKMSTRYILAFEDEFTSLPAADPAETPPPGGSGAQNPCPDTGHGRSAYNSNRNNGLSENPAEKPCLESGHGAVSRNHADPCPENPQSRVQNLDTNLVREPLREPVKEEEDARAREANFDLFFGALLKALGFDPDGTLPGWWQDWPPRVHVRRWIDDLGLSEDTIIAVATETRRDHPAPPDGPKALDCAIERAARRAAQEATAPANGQTAGRQRKLAKTPRRSPDELAAFYADLVNSDRYLPANMISNAMRDAMLARGLVTEEQLRLRGVR